MKQTKVSNIPIYTFDIFEKYPEVTAFCTTRLGGISEVPFEELNLGLHVGDAKEKVIKNRELLCEATGINFDRLTCTVQTHSSNIAIVDYNSVGKGSHSWEEGIADTDALATNISDTPLAIFTADCAGIYIYDPVKKVIAVIHAGRKGTEDEILIKTIQKMKDVFDCCPENMIVGVGPCIHKCCYEIDIPSLLREQLLEAGVKVENIEISDICTCCNSDIFYSYRASEGKTGRFANIIKLS